MLNFPFEEKALLEKVIYNLSRYRERFTNNQDDLRIRNVNPPNRTSYPDRYRDQNRKLLSLFPICDLRMTTCWQVLSLKHLIKSLSILCFIVLCLFDLGVFFACNYRLNDNFGY